MITRGMMFLLFAWVTGRMAEEANNGPFAVIAVIMALIAVVDIGWFLRKQIK